MRQNVNMANSAQTSNQFPYIYLTPHEPYLVPKGEAEEASGAPEVEVTPAMIEAGLPHLLRFHRETDDDESVVRQIFLSMFQAYNS